MVDVNGNCVVVGHMAKVRNTGGKAGSAVRCLFGIALFIFASRPRSLAVMITEPSAAASLNRSHWNEGFITGPLVRCKCRRVLIFYPPFHDTFRRR